MEIRLIGEPAILRDGNTQALTGSRKTRALLAYLILSPGPVSRERLCEIFWQIPDDPRGSLRWSLSKLRSLVDEEGRRRIVADREQVTFDPVDVDVDILDIRSEISNGPEKLTLKRLTYLASASSAGFLRGLELSGQPEFEHFLSSERESFRVMRTGILLALTARLEDRPADAVRWLQDLVDIEPYAVDVHRKLIETLAMTGRKQDAERQLAASLTTLADIETFDRSALEQAVRTRPVATIRSDTPVADERKLHEKDTRHQELRYCKADDGTRIAYTSVGEGPPLIKAANWLNHLEFDWEPPVWRHVFRGLSENRTLVRYDARGNGLSDWNVEDFHLERQVADLEAVVAATGLDRFPLLALSQGCAVSAEFSARYPEKVTHLILVGGYARGWRRIGTPDVIRQNEAMITLVGMGWGQDNPAFRQMFTSMFMPDAPSENQTWFNELQRMTTTPENAVKLIRANGEVDVLDRLGEVKAPTLVLHAANDMRIPFNSGRELAAGIPGARFVSLDSRNHLMPETDPAWPVLLRTINDFLNG